MADEEARKAWEAHPNDVGSQFFAQQKARAARQPEPDPTEDQPKSCAYYKWLQENEESAYPRPNWTYYDGGCGSGKDGGGGSGVGGGKEGVGGGLDEPDGYEGSGSGGSSDFECGYDWDA